MNYFYRTLGLIRGCGALMCLLWLGALSVNALEYFVRSPQTCTNTIAQSPFTNWDMAATQIQWAVNAAAAGDTVWVSNGVYATTTPTPVYDYSLTVLASNVVALTNANITLRSVNGPLVTVIDGSSKWRAVSISVTIASATTLNGFTIRNGTTPNHGGGITIGNYNGHMPGPIIITNCIVNNNTATWYGGGLWIQDVYCVIANCLIYSNATVSGGGGGINIGYGGNSVIDRCVFFGNQSMGTGIDSGGGLSIDASTCFVRNSLFYRNNSSKNGGGLTLRSAYAGLYNTIENCTIVNNTASNAGGGIAMYDDLLLNTSVMHNLVVNNNSATSIYADVYATNTVFTNCCIGNTNGVFNWNTSGNITNAPALAGTNVDNYRLSANSPCINTGTNQGWMTGAVDLDGNRRLDRLSGLVDMGAYEFIYKFTLFKMH